MNKIILGLPAKSLYVGGEVEHWLETSKGIIWEYSDGTYRVVTHGQPAKTLHKLGYKLITGWDDTGNGEYIFEFGSDVAKSVLNVIGLT